MEDRFNKFVEWVGDRIDRGLEYEFDLEMFEKYFPFIKNKDMLERCIDEGMMDNISQIVDGIDDGKIEKIIG